MSDSTFLHTLNDFFLSLSPIRGASEIENNDLFGVVVTVATIVHLPHELVLVIIDSAQIIFRTQYINFHNDLPQKKERGYRISPIARIGCYFRLCVSLFILCSSPRWPVIYSPNGATSSELYWRLFRCSEPDTDTRSRLSGGFAERTRLVFHVRWCWTLTPL